MTQPAPQPDGSRPLSRRDLLRLGAASLGAPLVVPSATPHVPANQPAQVPAEATPTFVFPTWNTFPVWEGDTYPGHPEPRARTVNNLMFMGLAMHNFAASHGGRFPSAAIRRDDKATLSWRVAILPYLEQFALYEKFHLDEAWDSPHNVSLLKEMPRVYAPVTPSAATAGSTYYQWVVGPGSRFAGEEGTRVAEVDWARPSLMIVEAAEPVLWTMPEDLPYDDEKPLLRLGGPFEGGSYAAFADGSVRFLSDGHAPETLRAIITQRPPSTRDPQ